MQSGVLSSENVADVLRGISQRRRQGVLEVNAHNETIAIKFVQGRVVEACTTLSTPARETAAWFERAGYPTSDPESYKEDSYGELLPRLRDELADHINVTADLLKFVVAERVLDRLYKLEVGAGSFYTFKVQMIDCDREFSPSISIGQVLLDLVEMHAGRQEFESMFEPGSMVKLTGDAPDGLEPEEAAIVRVIGTGANIDGLAERSLLSDFHFMHAMVQLGNASVISVGDAVTGAGAGADLDAFLSDSIDAAFGMDEAVLAPAHVQSVPREDLQGLVDEEITAEEGEEPFVRSAYLQSCSAQLLQNTLIPRLIAIGFTLAAVLSPFLAWSNIMTLFADM